MGQGKAYNRVMTSSTDAASRFAVALDLQATGIDLMRARLRREHPDESAEQAEARLRAWLEAPDAGLLEAACFRLRHPGGAAG